MECLNELSALLAVRQPDVALLAVLTTRYCIPEKWPTVLHHICSTETSFDLRCESVTCAAVCTYMCCMYYVCTCAICMYMCCAVLCTCAVCMYMCCIYVHVLYVCTCAVCMYMCCMYMVLHCSTSKMATLYTINTVTVISS